MGEESGGGARRAHWAWTTPPVNLSATSGGAGCPTWNPIWVASLGVGEPPTRLDADGATEADGEADDGDAAIDGEGDGATEGDGDGEAAIDGDGVGRRPTGSGPTKTNAARMPAAASTPTTRPAMIARADFMRREGTSTDGPKAARTGRW
jgi:hypothetical protein